MSGEFSVVIRKRFLTERVVWHWSRLPWELVITPSPSEFKECLGNTLSPVV